MSERAVANVGEIAALTDGPFGSNLKTSHYVDEGPRVIRLQNIGDGVFRDERAHITPQHFGQLAKHHVEPGDIVVASLGENPPRACLVPSWLGDALVKADCIRVRPTDAIEAPYLMWMLNSPPVRAQASSRVKGVGRPRLGLGGIRQLDIPLPPLNEQRRIVAAIEEHLSCIDAADASLAAVLRRLDVLRLAQQAERLENGWPERALGEIADNLDSRRVPVNRSERAKRPGDVPYYGATGQVGWIDEPLFDEELCLVGEDGAPFLDRAKSKAYVITGPSWVNNHAHVLRARSDLATNRYLKLALDAVDYEPFVNGTTRLKLTKGALSQIPIPLPPLEEQRRIVAEVEERLSRIDALRASIERAQRRSAGLRAAILAKAFRGGLVPQDPADEPAEALLARIRATRMDTKTVNRRGK